MNDFKKLIEAAKEVHEVLDDKKSKHKFAVKRASVMASNAEHFASECRKLASQYMEFFEEYVETGIISEEEVNKLAKALNNTKSVRVVDFGSTSAAEAFKKLGSETEALATCEAVLSGIAKGLKTLK
jgi:intergrase/recombinase